MINLEETQKRKQNMRIYSLYRAISMDLLFFYAIDFIFLTQVKNISPSDVVLKSSFYALFMIILQIPASMLIDKIGTRKCTIIANVFNILYLVIIMFSRNLFDLIIAEFLSAICFSIKDISDTTLLNKSIPKVRKKGEIFSKIEGRGSKNYYYLNAITSFLAGFLYTVNPYLPIILATIISIFATILSTGFEEIKSTKYKKITDINEYIKDVKESFKFIIKSNRLRSLVLYSGIIWGVFCLVSTYRASLLDDIGISATWIAIVSAIVGIATGIGSKYQLKIHKKYRNKSLSLLAIITTIAIILTGLVGISGLSSDAIMILVLTFNIVLNMAKGVYGVLITRYLSNFSNSKILPKIYSANAISRNVFRMLIGFLGAYLLELTTTAHAEILVGIIFAIVTMSLISYMKTRTGLKAEEYKEEEIKFDISKKM